MLETIQFHLDENVSQAIAKGVRRRGIDVTTTPETGLIAASDETQLEFARSQGRVEWYSRKMPISCVYIKQDYFTLALPIVGKVADR